MKQSATGRRIAILVIITAILVLFQQAQPASAAPKSLDALKGYKLTAFDGGKTVDVAELGKGKPFYLVFSTAT